MIKIAPSILAADPLNLERDVKAAEKAGCDWIHVDIMDAHFVPNLAYSADTVGRLRKTTDLPLDVHLMMDNPEVMIDPFLDAGASCITIHAEIGVKAPGLLTKAGRAGDWQDPEPERTRLPRGDRSGRRHYGSQSGDSGGKRPDGRRHGDGPVPE